MITDQKRDAAIILALLQETDPSEHPARLVALISMAAGALVTICGERKAYEHVQRVADAVIGVSK